MSEITNPIILDSTGHEIVNALNVIAIAQAGGVDQKINFAGQRNLVDMGLGAKAMPTGTIETVEIEAGMAVTTTSSSIASVAVNEVLFIQAAGEVANKIYEFVYDGVVWKLNGNSVNIAEYGITFEGTPDANDTIVVTETDNSVEVVVLDHDYDTPANSEFKHSMTMQMLNCLQNMQFDAPEALFYVDPTDYPSGLTSGTTYTIEVLKGAYNNSTSQDGTIGFTPTQDVPAGGYVRHSTLGVYRSDNTYTRAALLAGKFITYGPNFIQIEQLETIDAPEGTSLGTCTAEDVGIKTAHMNYTRRQAHGCNRWDQSNIRQRLNSAGTGWFTKQNEWDFPPANVETMVGFLSMIDPALRKVMKKVKKIHALGTCDGDGFVETEDYVFLVSNTEVGFGQNNSISETSYGVDGSATSKTVPYAYYNGATNADRIKKLNSAARIWWLRGPDPTLANFVRCVRPSGATYGDLANSAYGLAAAWAI